VTDTPVSWETCIRQCLSLSGEKHVTGLDRNVSDPEPRVFGYKLRCCEGVGEREIWEEIS